ncbi:MAG: ATP-binding protein [Actinobacteria bacterium]|nr:MAG: ATP-binding protein [Actinomycetota bacterium]
MELRNATEVLAAGPQAPSLARRFVAKALDSWDQSDLRERALLAVSELVTNAFLYGEGDIVLVVTLGVVLRVEVRDEGSGLPAQRNYSPTSTTGRGLHLVGHMADRWGTSAPASQANGGKGKAVWFEIDTPAPKGARATAGTPVQLTGLAGKVPAKIRPGGVDEARLRMAV